MSKPKGYDEGFKTGQEEGEKEGLKEGNVVLFKKLEETNSGGGYD